MAERKEKEMERARGEERGRGKGRIREKGRSRREGTARKTREVTKGEERVGKKVEDEEDGKEGGGPLSVRNETLFPEAGRDASRHRNAKNALSRIELRQQWRLSTISWT